MKNILENRYTYAQYLALAATIVNVIGVYLLTKITPQAQILTLVTGLLCCMGLLLTLCSYCLGGLLTAIKSVLKIGFWGWVVIPFPYCLLSGLMSMVFAGIAFVLLPIFPVRKAARENMY